MNRQLTEERAQCTLPSDSRKYFEEVYHSKKRQYAAKEAELKGLAQEIAAYRKLAGLTDKH